MYPVVGSSTSLAACCGTAAAAHHSDGAAQRDAEHVCRTSATGRHRGWDCNFHVGCWADRCVGGAVHENCKVTNAGARARLGRRGHPAPGVAAGGRGDARVWRRGRGGGGSRSGGTAPSLNACPGAKWIQVQYVMTSCMYACDACQFPTTAAAYWSAWWARHPLSAAAVRQMQPALLHVVTAQRVAVGACPTLQDTMNSAVPPEPGVWAVLTHALGCAASQRRANRLELSRIALIALMLTPADVAACSRTRRRCGGTTRRRRRPRA